MGGSSIVTVKQGKIRGIKEVSEFSGTEYYAFYGVPYGQPTNDERRFRDPVKIESWNDVYDATIPKDGCSQFSLQSFQFTGTEDCLYLNIYTPKLSLSHDDSLKPVIVNIHPGGLVHGAPESREFGSPDFVMHNDVVYICIAYRLHILGFLNLGMKECSGNQGLKDIIMALEWIKENIEAFSGDSENITLLGSSSGCEIIHLLMLSPLAKGLFHKAVIMGMYAFNPALFRRNHNESEKTAIHIARELGYKGDNKKALLAFLKKMPVDAIVQEMKNFRKHVQCFAEVFVSGAFFPTIDQGEKAVLPVSPRDLIPSMAKIPVLFGICERESVMGFIFSRRKKTEKYFLTTYRQNEWGWGYQLTDNDVKVITKKSKSFYSNGKPLEEAPLGTKVDIQTDIGFSDLYASLLDVVSKDLPSSVYVYKFLFEGCLSTLKDRLNPLLGESLDGTFHASDFEYWSRLELVSNTLKKRSFDSKTVNFVKMFTKLISTFVRTGNPNYEGLPIRWKPTTPENPCHLIIKDRLTMVDGKLNGARMKFWEDLKKEFDKD